MSLEEGEGERKGDKCEKSRVRKVERWRERSEDGRKRESK